MRRRLQVWNREAITLRILRFQRKRLCLAFVVRRPHLKRQLDYSSARIKGVVVLLGGQTQME